MKDPKDASTFEIYDTINLGNWLSRTVSFDHYYGDNKFIAFMIDGQSENKSFTAYIDQIEIDSLIKCQAPINLQSKDVKATSALISWESVSDYDSIFNLQITTVDVGYNVEFVDSITEFIVDTIIYGNNALILNLEQNTDYYYYVRAVCDTSFSTRYSSSQTFKTSCLAINLPFYEGFNDNEFLNDCWTIERSLQSGTSLNSWTLYQKQDENLFSGKGCLQLQDMSNGNKTNLVLPLFSMHEEDTYIIRFMMYRSSTDKLNEGVKVWINNSPDTIVTHAQELMYIHRCNKYSPFESTVGWFEYHYTFRANG